MCYLLRQITAGADEVAFPAVGIYVADIDAGMGKDEVAGAWIHLIMRYNAFVSQKFHTAASMDG